MRAIQVTAIAAFMVLVLVVACAPEFVPQIVTTREPVRGGLDEMGVMDAPTSTPTPTPTIIPGMYYYKSSDGATGDCEANYYAAIPTDVDVLEDTTNSSGAESGFICNMTGGINVIEVEALGKASGWSYGVDWKLEGYGALFEPVPTVTPDTNLCFGGFLGGGLSIEGQTDIIDVYPYSGYDVYIINASSASVDFFCAPGVVESHHGWNILDLGTPTPTGGGGGACTSSNSDICIVEISASQDITPTTSAHLDYNLRGGKGANDEFVEVVCFEPMSAAGWSLTDGTITYTYAQDNFCWPLKVIFCDEMQECDDDTGIPDSGTWYLYDPDGNLKDTRTYPTMATPGNSWYAESYLDPAGDWSEVRPNPGTFITQTPTPTATATRTPTPTPTVTPTP